MNQFNIYKGVPNPQQLVLVPKVSTTDLTNIKIEIYNKKEKLISTYTVGNGITITNGKVVVTRDIQNLEVGYYTAYLYLNNSKSQDPLILKVK